MAAAIAKLPTITPADCESLGATGDCDVIPHKAFPTILGTFNNARGWIRTNDPRFRRPMLYPQKH